MKLLSVNALLTFIIASGLDNTAQSPGSLECPNVCECSSVTLGVKVSCRGQRLTSLPWPIPADTAVLDLKDNYVKNLTAEMFQNLTQLKELGLEKNRIQILPRGTFTNLPMLLKLDLDSNTLHKLPPGLFDDLRSLESLTLRFNDLEEFPAGLFDHLSNLKELILHDNRIGTMNHEAFRNLTNLTKIDLSGNNLDELPADLFDGLIELEFLSLRDNHLRELPAGLFDDLGNLNRLILDTNKLQSLPPGIFKSLAKVKWLTLSSNNLRGLPDGLFDGLAKLENLNLFNTDLQKLPHGIFDHVSSLKRLLMYSNSLRDLPSGVFDNLGSLKSLFIHDNELRNLSFNVFGNLSSLTDLRLSDNRLQYLPSKTFDSLTSLRSLWLHSNELQSLPAGIFENLVSLRNLKLQRNKLETLPRGIFKNLVGLEKLFLSKNKLTRIPAGLFDNSTPLEELWLDSNNIVALDPSAFESLRHLTFLIVKDNKLTSLSPGMFKSLTQMDYLDFSENELKEVPSEIFEDLVILRGLILDNNNLTSLHDDSLKGLAKLKILYLHKNEMRTLPDGVFDEMKYLMKVTLDRNMMCCYLHKQDAICSYTYAEQYANCEYLLKNPGPRICIWVIGVLALFGNAFVIGWRFMAKKEEQVQSAMLIHLAVADSLMGIYLIIIGVKDMQWAGQYYKEDYAWRSGVTCQIAGALSVLSSEVSVMILTLITADRLAKIVLNCSCRGFTARKRQAFCAIIWMIGSVIAFLPSFGIQYFDDSEYGFYGHSVTCLPLQLTTHKWNGWEYSMGVFVVFNSASILFIMVAYLLILFKSYRLSRNVDCANMKMETSLARRVIVIILTDMVCWMPIIVLGILSTVDSRYNPQKDSSIWIAVFALPINSALNPVLFTLSTRKVQKVLRHKLRMAAGFFSQIFFRNQQQEEMECRGRESQVTEEFNFRVLRITGSPTEPIGEEENSCCNDQEESCEAKITLHQASSGRQNDGYEAADTPL